MLNLPTTAKFHSYWIWPGIGLKGGGNYYNLTVRFFRKAFSIMPMLIIAVLLTVLVSALCLVIEAMLLSSIAGERSRPSRPARRARGSCSRNAATDSTKASRPS